VAGGAAAGRDTGRGCLQQQQRQAVTGW
jgi:hypothetical protein